MPEEGRLCIYIPSYNTRPFLKKTVGRIPFDRLPADLKPAVLFVDNASADGTPEQIEASRQMLAARGIASEAILHPVNRGYGGSVKSAFRYCSRNAMDFVVVLHADGQYAPELMPELLECLRSDDTVAMHFGSRLSGKPLEGRMPFYKYAANHLLSGLQNLVIGAHHSEYHSGYRLYRMRLVRKLPIQRLDDGFVFDNQIIFLIHEHGYGISESPIPTYYGDEKSNVPRIGTPLAILASLGTYALHRWRLKRSPLYEAGEFE